MDKVIQRRRENVEKWRLQHKKTTDEGLIEIPLPTNQTEQESGESKPALTWNFDEDHELEEDDSEDQIQAQTSNTQENDNVDALNGTNSEKYTYINNTMSSPQGKFF